MSGRLFFRKVGEGQRCIVLIHGIMGSSRNLVGFAKLLTENFPDWQVWIPDLRHHGESGYFEPPNTIDSCAQDVFEWIKDQNIKVDMLIGHSYGGKVVLRLNELMPMKQVWVWDAEPGHRKPGKTDEMIKQLKSIPMPQKSKQDVLQAMLDLGLPRETALWMMMNVMSVSEANPSPQPSPTRGEGVIWKFDFNLIEQLLLSFRETAITPQSNTDFVKAERNPHITLPLSDKVHLLKNAGHWVHADNPKGLLDLMAESFK